MPRVLVTQSNFNTGAIDPLLAARVDIESYANAVQFADNCVSPPQGGIARRPGTQYVATLTDSVGGTPTKARIFAFSFNTQQDYLLAFTDQKIEIFKNDVSIVTVASPYLADDLFAIDATQSADTMIIVHPDYEPRTLVRTADELVWTLSTITFLDVPEFDYNDALSPAATPEVQDLTFSGFGANRLYRLELDGLVTEELDYSTSSTADNETKIRRALESLPTLPAGDVDVTFLSGTTYRITLAGGAADAWPLIVGRVTLGDGSISVSRVQAGVARKELVWSDVRGWPNTVTFHESRLWFGGTRSRPQTVFGSQVGDFFNFFVGEGLDAEAIVVTLDTDQVNAITAVHSARHFQVFTTGGEFFVPSPEAQPITPQSILFRRSTQHGTRKVRPVLMDGVTLFIERKGRIIREFVYEFAEEGYTAPSASLLSSHLIKDPVDMDALRGTAGDQANYVYLVNSDGTVAVFNILRAQEVNTWTNWNTDGFFRSVAVVNEDGYFVVEREINGETKMFVERLRADGYTDCAVFYTGTPTDTISVAHLEGEAVKARADAAVVQVDSVSGGSVTLPRLSGEVEVGLPFSPYIEMMTPAPPFAEGSTFNRRKRIVRASANVFQTLGLIINGEPQPSRTFGPDTLDKAPVPFTGQFEVFILGWEDFPTVKITQVEPLPMYIRNMIQEVEVS